MALVTVYHPTFPGTSEQVDAKNVTDWTEQGWRRTPIEAGDAKGDDSKSGYSGLKVDELKDAIASRNEGRDEADLLSDEGKKAALIAVLEADDADAPPPTIDGSLAAL